MNECSDFWSALAPFHAEVEDSNFDIASARRLLPEIRSRVLVVGAGHGLIVEELRKHGHDCDGVDLNDQMVQQALLRRGIELTQADARDMPLPAAGYETVIYATGVVDFTVEDNDIRAMLAEGRRVITRTGKIFIAFHKASPAQQHFLALAGLLSEGRLAFRESLELYLLNPARMVGWLARRSRMSHFRAALALMRVSLLCTSQERRMTLRMQRIIRRMDDPRTLIQSAPEKLPYRDRQAIQDLFERLSIPIKQVTDSSSCSIVLI